MGEYIAVIDEEFDYPMPTIESLRNQIQQRNSYTEEEREAYINIVIEAIASTDKGMHRLCRAFKEIDPKFPNPVMVLDWIGKSRERTEQYARAKDKQMDLIAEDTIHIADTERDPNRARVRIDARKWVASKLAPKKYGDRLDVSHTGNLNLTALTDQELMRIAQEQSNGPILIDHTTSSGDE